MDLQNLLSKKEELHPDLQSYIENSPIGLCLKHPLVFGMFYSESMNAMYNAQYVAKKEYIKKAIRNKQWNSYIWMHERPYRLDEFIKIQNNLSDDEYWNLLGEIWSDSENLWQYGLLLKFLINKNRPNRESMMDDKEKEFFKKLPDEFIIYRGHQIKNRLGYSWTLSNWKAKWFAKRLDCKRNGVVQAIVKKEDVVAVLLRRGEFEIIVSPENLENVKAIKEKKRQDWIDVIKFKNSVASKLSKMYSYHGPWHWEKVEQNALILAKETKDADKIVAQLFAYIHDAKRENEDHDPMHGHRAAEYAQTLFDRGELKINQDQLKLLIEACKYHNDGKTTEDPTIGVCWDADRLDLTRVGIIPDLNLLSTEAAKKLIWTI